MRRLAAGKRLRLLIGWTAGCVVSAAAAVALIAGFGQPPDPAAPGAGGQIDGLTNVLERKATAAAATIVFEDVTERAGIVFRHFPARRESLIAEDMGSGLAWGDYDGDGDDDLFAVNFAGGVLADATPAGPAGRHALFRNEGDGLFADVTAAAGLDRETHGMGAAWGDYDNDGDLDLYITNYGPNLLFRNEGNGTFTDVSAAAGVADAGFGAGCAWADYDRDGWIDLYVCNYVEFVFRKADRLRAARNYGSEIPYTLNPSSYLPQPNCLYRNNGDGTFADAAEAAGVCDPEGRSLSAAWLDFDDDGWPDLYVANDVSRNGVFRNLGDGTFADIGADSLAADYRGAMGIAVGDPDRDGDQDLFITHWLAQENAFFESHYAGQETLGELPAKARLFFMDQADEFGLGHISIDMVGWSTAFGDLDNDGWLDLWVVNGSTLECADDHARLEPQVPFLFRQAPGEGFFEVGRSAHPAFGAPRVGRGGAQADFDGDGRLDLALAVHGGRPILLRNVSDTGGHWLAVRLAQRGGNTQALGARVCVRAGGVQQCALVGTGGAYLSQNATDLHFGLGEHAVVDQLEVHWPDGVREILTDVAANRLLELSHDAAYPVRVSRDSNALLTDAER